MSGVIAAEPERQIQLSELGTLPGADYLDKVDNGVVHHTNPDGTSVGTIKIPFGYDTHSDVASASFQWDGDENSPTYYKIMNVKKTLEEGASKRTADTSGIQSFMREIDETTDRNGLIREDKVYSDNTHDAAMQMHVSHQHGYAGSHFENHYHNNKPVNNQFGASAIIRDNYGKVTSGKKMVTVPDGNMGPTKQVEQKMDHNDVRIYQIKKDQKENADVIARQVLRQTYDGQQLRITQEQEQKNSTDAALEEFKTTSQEFTQKIGPILAERNIKTILNAKYGNSGA